MPHLSKLLGILVVAAALLWRPILVPVLQWMVTWPYDESIGEIPVLNRKELSEVYQNKNVLIVGGTRGTGFGTAVVLAKAGAHVTVVGRREKSGRDAVDKLQAVAQNAEQRFHYQSGDLGSVQTSLALMENLKKSDSRYDILVVSAGIFPDWSSLHNEDGFEKMFAVGVVGRFLLYRHMHDFLAPPARVLNILASGMQMIHSLDRTMAVGETSPSTFARALDNMCTAHELMLVGIENKIRSAVPSVTMVSTHPGIIATELHQGQGFFVDTMMKMGEWMLGISEEECGLRQASILASSQLHDGGLSYVDAFSVGRKRSARLQKRVDEHLDWLWAMLEKHDRPFN